MTAELSVYEYMPRASGSGMVACSSNVQIVLS